MGVIKNLPVVEKINGRWVVDAFTGSPASWDYPKFQGKVGTLYVVECAGYLKIGLTSRPIEMRLHAIDASCPLPTRKVRLQSIPLASLAYAESYLHNVFRDKCVKGEWFDVSEAEVLSAIPGAVARARAYEAACYHHWCKDEERKQDPKFQARMRRQYAAFLAKQSETAEAA